MVHDIEDAESPCFELYWMYLMSGTLMYFRLNERLVSIVVSLV